MDAIDDGGVGACVPKAAARLEAHRLAEPEPLVCRVGSDRLELADAVLLVEPDERVGGEAAVGRLDDEIELLAVGRTASAGAGTRAP